MRQLLITCFVAITCCVCLQSCFTALFLQDIRGDVQPDRVRNIKSAGFDSSGALLINFTARLDGRFKARPYHIAVNVDSEYVAYHKRYTARTTGLQRPTYVNGMGVYHEEGVAGTGLNIGFKRGIIEKGFAANSIVNNATGIRVYKGYKAFRPIGYSNTRHIVFIVPDTAKQNSPEDIDYTSLNIDLGNKRKYVRYALVPLVAAADVVTSPLQLIGLGLLAVAAHAMKY